MNGSAPEPSERDFPISHGVPPTFSPLARFALKALSDVPAGNERVQVKAKTDAMDPEYQKLLSTPRKAKIVQDFSPLLRSFVAHHQLAEPKWALCRPLDFCREKRCFVNVDKQVSKMGGSSLSGWLFWEVERTVLETEAHCIWVTPQGTWVDITPQSPLVRRILFSPDSRVSERRGLTVGYETPLTDNQKVLALQKFTRALSLLRQEYVQAFGKELFTPTELFSQAAKNSGLPEDVANFLLQKFFAWERTVAEKYRG